MIFGNGMRLNPDRRVVSRRDGDTGGALKSKKALLAEEAIKTLIPKAKAPAQAPNPQEEDNVSRR